MASILCPKAQYIFLNPLKNLELKSLTWRHPLQKLDFEQSFEFETSIKKKLLISWKLKFNAQ